jgi:hypothetical protein
VNEGIQPDGWVMITVRNKFGTKGLIQDYVDTITATIWLTESLDYSRKKSSFFRRAQRIVQTSAFLMRWIWLILYFHLGVLNPLGQGLLPKIMSTPSGGSVGAIICTHKVEPFFDPEHLSVFRILADSRKGLFGQQAICQRESRRLDRSSPT